jgi:hypothetical protein
MVEFVAKLMNTSDVSPLADEVRGERLGLLMGPSIPPSSPATNPPTPYRSMLSRRRQDGRPCLSEAEAVVQGDVESTSPVADEG